MENRDAITPGLLERPRPTIFAALILISVAIAGLWFSGLLLWRILPLEGEAQRFLLDVLYYVPFVALPVALYALRRPGISASMRLNPMPVFPTLIVVLLALFSVYIASAVDGLWGLLLNAAGFNEPQASVDVSTSRALTLAILHSAAVPAICEELLFRGVVFSAFESRGTKLALWVSSIFFALMHGNLYGLPAYIMVGAIAAFLVFALDSLYAGMIYHTVYNAAILLLMHILPATDEAGAVALQASTLISLAIDIVALGLLMLLTLRTLDLRRRAKGIAAVPRIKQPLRRREWAMLIVLALMFIGTGALVLMEV